MTPAREPRPRGSQRLLLVDPCGADFRDALLSDLPDLLRAGDLLVVNDAATLPASLRGRLGERAVELRLAAAHPDGTWSTVFFGEGDWRTPTEYRPAPPEVKIGDTFALGGDLAATVLSISPFSPRLVRIRFASEGARLFGALYRAGRPVQYSYLSRDLETSEVQTTFASRPWAVEPPSAGLPLDWELLFALRRRGVETTMLTHAAGLSSTGDPALDSALPLAERYEIPVETARAIERTRQRGGRVIAVGTTVVRALESAGRKGTILPGAAETELRIGSGFPLRVVNGIVTGLHEREASHFALLEAFASREVLERAWGHAERQGYLGHEFGDVALLRCA